HAKVELVVSLPEAHIPPVRAAKGRLDDIWLNLLINAFDAVKDLAGAKIRVEASYDDGRGEVFITISDNGPGISADIIDKVFSPFFTTKPVGEGTGLGLHISREIAESAGGAIQVESKPYNQTVFTVRLP